jgi:hypothetical protein
MTKQLRLVALLILVMAGSTIQAYALNQHQEIGGCPEGMLSSNWITITHTYDDGSIAYVDFWACNGDHSRKYPCKRVLQSDPTVGMVGLINGIDSTNGNNPYHLKLIHNSNGDVTWAGGMTSFGVFWEVTGWSTTGNCGESMNNENLGMATPMKEMLMNAAIGTVMAGL